MDPISTPESAGTGSTKRRPRPYRRSGFYTLKSTLRALGPRVIDKRTALGKQLAQWRADLVRDLGGEAAMSTQQLALVDVVVRQKLLLDSIDAYLLTQPSLVNARKRTLLPVVRERQQLADAMARYLAQLGLERRTRESDVGQLMAVLQGKTGVGGAGS